MEYWYLWLLLIVLCVITVFVLSKASAAAKKHNNERDALLREYDRKKALKDEFSFLTREKAESSDPETLFEGVSAVLQAKTEKAEDPEKVFGKFTEAQKYIYTLYSKKSSCNANIFFIQIMRNIYIFEKCIHIISLKFLRKIYTIVYNVNTFFLKTSKHKHIFKSLCYSQNMLITS